MIKLWVNGEAKKSNAKTVADLIEELGLVGMAVAVEVNQCVVPKKQHRDAVINEGDKIELVTLVGGG